MENSRSKKELEPHNLYTEEDYNEVIFKLPDIIKDITKKAGQVLEPTVDEKNKIMSIIKDFIHAKDRKVYGGTAINELIKAKNPDDAIYTDYAFSDIEFYSPEPVEDLVELTNILYEKGYPYVEGREAQHEETYSIFANFQLYCDISYVPKHVYYGIKVVKINGINYVDPHFILIDQLRIINQPLTAAEQRWMKTFDRMYKLLKYYPLAYFDRKLSLTRNSNQIQSLIQKLKSEFIYQVSETCLITGYEAYNFFIRHAMQDRTVEQQARMALGAENLSTLIINGIPYIEFVSVNYRESVISLYNYVRSIVDDKSKVKIEEYFPLFQFTGYSATIMYGDSILAKIYDADGFCVPNIKTRNGYMYVTYQYLLMYFLINRFREHLNKRPDMYFNYTALISNLITARNDFLNRNNLGVINESVFSDFRISCLGTTMTYSRASRLRAMERYAKGIRPFRYVPQDFFSKPLEEQDKFDPTKKFFKNTSGNKIFNEKNLLFKLDSEGNIESNENSVISTDQERIHSDLNSVTELSENKSNTD